MAQLGKCESFRKVGKKNVKLAMIKDENSAVDMGQIECWGIWILLQVEQEAINCLTFVGRSSAHICGLRGLCLL